MANFNTHFSVSAGASALLSSTLLSMNILAPQEALSAFFIGTFGGLLPDIDSAYSTSIKIAFNIFSFLASIILIFLHYEHYSLIEILVLSLAIFLFIRYVILEVFRKITVHRGIFHSVPMAVVWGILLTILLHLLFKMDGLISWIYGLMLTFGYIVHLTLDEIYSVDLGNIRMKKSFGTALKFSNFSTTFGTLQTIFIYISIALLLKVAPDSTSFKETIFTQEAWTHFQEILFPKDGNWFAMLKKNT